MKKLIIILCILFPAAASAGGMRLSHIDSSTLLVDQKVKLYIGLTDTKGLPVEDLKRSDFEIFESTDGRQFKRRDRIYGFRRLVNYENGIQFLLMVDNSGSMYSKTHRGSSSTTKIESAKDAVRSFINDMSNPQDRVAFASYNTTYIQHSVMSPDPETIIPLLEHVQKPEGDDRYTEIYGSLVKGIESLKQLEGRKVIIILSDGENCPLYTETGREHPEYGKTVYGFEAPLEMCHKEGITVFAVHYGSESRDPHLSRIAIESGGAVFNAAKDDDLSAVYADIVNQLIHEYQIVYRAGMEPAEKRFVKVVYTGGKSPVSAVRYYFSSTVFGLPVEDLLPLLIIPLLLGIILLYLLFKRKNNAEESPSISVLDSGGLKANTENLTLNKGHTVIGSADGSDITLSGRTSDIEASHATVLYDRKTKGYTLISDAEVSVNNNSVKQKRLESGDVIRVGDTTLVFDEGMA